MRRFRLGLIVVAILGLVGLLGLGSSFAQSNQVEPTVTPEIIEFTAPPLVVVTEILPDQPIFFPTPTPLSSTTSSDGAVPAWVSDTLPWILLIVGFLAGLGAFFGWWRERKRS